MGAPNFRKLERTELCVPPTSAGARLDRFLADQFPDYSRSLLAGMIKDGLVSVEGLSAGKVKPALKLEAGWNITVEKPTLDAPDLPPEDIPLAILFEDESLLVIDKPPDLPVHPPRAGRGGTLANALAHHCANLPGGKLPGDDPVRPGIVHRLDADTSGVIVVAKDESALFKLSKQFETRTVEKVYLALCRGKPRSPGAIDKSIGRHPDHYEMMRIDPAGKNAITEYEVLEQFKTIALVKLRPRTGRTHQLRVHLSAINHPIVGDRLYSRRPPLTRSEIAGREPEPGEAPLIARQALHAASLSFDHPRTGERLTFEAPLPEDFQRALQALRESRPPRKPAEGPADSDE